MSRTYRDLRKYRQKHKRWILAYEPGRERWEKPGVPFKDIDPPPHGYTKRTRIRVKQALRCRHLDDARLYARRRYNNHEG